MKKKLITTVMTLAIAGIATTAIGDGQLKISLDDKRMNSDVPASSAESVQEIINKLGGLTAYDKKSGKLEIEKPSVNLLVLEGIQQSKNKNIMFSNPIKGYNDKDVPRSFGVFVEVDDAPVSKELKMRLVLVGPNGKEVDKGKEWTFNTKNGTSFYFSEPFISTKFEQYGTYTVQLHMKSDKHDRNVVVGENSITIGR